MTEEIAVREEAHLPAQTLWGTDDPEAVLARASGVATVLQKMLKTQKLTSNIGGKDYILAEGWTCLGSMLGVFARTAWTKPIEGGWEARVEAVTKNGEIVGAAEASCLRSERNWKSRDDYALRSMAQTRAMGKALRMPLGFVAVLAGYESTPFDEMPQPAPEVVAVAGVAARAEAQVFEGEVVDESDLPPALRADPGRVYDNDKFEAPRDADYPGSFVWRIGKKWGGQTLNEIGSTGKPGLSYFDWFLSDKFKKDDNAALEHEAAVLAFLGRQS